MAAYLLELKVVQLPQLDRKKLPGLGTFLAKSSLLGLVEVRLGAAGPAREADVPAGGGWRTSGGTALALLRRPPVEVGAPAEGSVERWAVDDGARKQLTVVAGQSKKKGQPPSLAPSGCPPISGRKKQHPLVLRVLKSHPYHGRGGSTLSYYRGAFEKQLTVVAGQSKKKGQLLLSIPRALWVSTDLMAEEAAPYANPVWTLAAGAAWLLREQARGRGSEWWPYLQILPAYVPLPYLFDAATLDELQSPSFVERIRMVREYYEQQYKLCRLPAIAFASLHQFLWALAIMNSRAFSTPAPGRRTSAEPHTDSHSANSDTSGFPQDEEREQERGRGGMLEQLMALPASERRRFVGEPMALVPIAELIDHHHPHNAQYKVCAPFYKLMFEAPPTRFVGEPMALVPIAELIHHQHPHNAQYKVQQNSFDFCAMEEVQRSAELSTVHASGFDFYAREEVQRGAELFTVYGYKPNHHLLLGYGFVLDDNPYDHVRLFPNLSRAIRTVAAVVYHQEGQDVGRGMGGGRGGEVRPGEVDLRAGLRRVWGTGDPLLLPRDEEKAVGGKGGMGGKEGVGGMLGVGGKGGVVHVMWQAAATAVGEVVKAREPGGTYAEGNSLPQLQLRQRIEKRSARETRGIRAEHRSGTSTEHTKEVLVKEVLVKEVFVKEEDEGVGVSVWAGGIVEPNLLAALAASWHAVHVSQRPATPDPDYTCLAGAASSMAGSSPPRYPDYTSLGGATSSMAGPSPPPPFTTFCQAPLPSGVSTLYLSLLFPSIPFPMCSLP
ncbi:unnamed protein product [Closterium sp. NIES-64]|nr:unnamed protein product [Closterium sp. NIES-64]